MPIIDTRLKDSGESIRAVSPVQPVARVTETHGQMASGGDGSTAGDGQRQHDQAASAADYARANAQIVGIYADLSASLDEPAALSQANDRLVALVGAPVVVLPLPPASQDMIERAIEVAKDIAAKAALARSAQANVNVGTVDQILSSAA